MSGNLEGIGKLGRIRVSKAAWFEFWRNFHLLQIIPERIEFDHLIKEYVVWCRCAGFQSLKEGNTIPFYIPEYLNQEGFVTFRGWSLG